MKIIRVTTSLDFGGIERRLTNISLHTDENEWIFCAIGKGGSAERNITDNNKKVICFNAPYTIPSLKAIYKLFRFFRKEKPEVVHTSGAEANFHGVIAAKLALVPLIVAEEVGIPSQSSIARKIFRIIYLFSDYVVGNSGQVIKYLNEENDVSKKKLRLIPNPVIFPDLPVIEKQNESLFRLISVSRLESIKNIESMLRVVAKLKDLDLPVCYSIIGEGNNMDDLRALANKLNIEDNIKFLGFQSNPYPFLLSSDLYVLTSFSEGFSNSLTEAMYSGIPSLTTRVGAAEEIIVDNENGWIVNVDDDEDLFAKMKSIIKMGNAKRAEIGEKGKATVVENYSLNKHVDLLMTIYKRDRK